MSTDIVDLPNSTKAKIYWIDCGGGEFVGVGHQYATGMPASVSATVTAIDTYAYQVIARNRLYVVLIES